VVKKLIGFVSINQWYSQTSLLIFFYDNVDFGVSKKFSDEKWEICLNANDIFNTFAIETTLSGDDLNLHKINYAETQTIFIGMKYKF
jgi:hypothetical protein